MACWVCGFLYGMGTVLGFSLNRMGSPVVGCVMLLQNSKLQEAGCILFFIVYLLPEWCLAYMCVSIETALMSMY